MNRDWPFKQKNYRRGFKIDNNWYSHIIDPRTVRPASHILSATVIAPNPVHAGALATAFNVFSPDESETLALTIPGDDTGSTCAMLIDVSAALMIFVSLTGFLMIFFLEKRRTDGLLSTVLGTILFLIIYFMFV